MDGPGNFLRQFLISVENITDPQNELLYGYYRNYLLYYYYYYYYYVYFYYYFYFYFYFYFYLKLKSMRKV